MLDQIFSTCSRVRTLGHVFPGQGGLMIIAAFLTVSLLGGCDGIGLRDQEEGTKFSVDVPHETLTSGKVQTENLDRGQYAAIKEGTQEVLRTEEAYRAFWQKIYANRSSVPERPDVNFQGQVVVAVVLGERRTGGYSVDLTSVKGAPNTDAIQVSFTEMVPGDDCGTTLALTSPYVLAAVDSDGQFTFEKSKKTRSCG